MKWINPENNLVGAVKQLQGILQDGYKVPKPKVVKVKETVFPPELSSLEFRMAWGRWVKFRAEKKKALTESTIDSQLKKLSKFKVETAIAMIEQSIEQGWIGLFNLDKEDVKSQPQQTMESQWEQRQGSYIRTAPVEQIKQTEAHNLQNPAFRVWAEKVRPELKEIVL